MKKNGLIILLLSSALNAHVLVDTEIQIHETMTVHAATSDLSPFPSSAPSLPCTSCSTGGEGGGGVGGGVGNPNSTCVNPSGAKIVFNSLTMLPAPDANIQENSPVSVQISKTSTGSGVDGNTVIGQPHWEGYQDRTPYLRPLITIDGHEYTINGGAFFQNESFDLDFRLIGTRRGGVTMNTFLFEGKLVCSDNNALAGSTVYSDRINISVKNTHDLARRIDQNGPRIFDTESRLGYKPCFVDHVSFTYITAASVVASDQFNVSLSVEEILTIQRDFGQPTSVTANIRISTSEMTFETMRSFDIFGQTWRLPYIYNELDNDWLGVQYVKKFYRVEYPVGDYARKSINECN